MRILLRFKFLIIGAFLVFLAGTIFFKSRNLRPDLTIMGYINMADGLGRQGVDLRNALKNDLTINFFETKKVKKAKIPRRMEHLLKTQPKKWGKIVVFEDILWSPWETSVNKLSHCPKDAIKISYSMYESNHIPQEWVEILNSKFDAVVVPSPFLVDVYEESGVKIPIFVVPLGICLEEFLKEPLKNACHHPMVFSNFSAAADRKNQIGLIRAFREAFGDDPGVLLRINARYSEKKVRNNITKELARLGNPRNIIFTEKSLNRKEYLKEFKKTDCYVSPSKGEGFSIQVREAMAMGIPVIATNNTGQIPVCETGLVLSVESKLPEIAVNPWGDYYGNHFNCELTDLVKALREMKGHYEDFLKNAEDARKWAEGFQYANLKPLYKSLIHPKKVVLGRENKINEEYIATNSIKLLKKYKDLLGDGVTDLNNEVIFNHIYDSGEWGRNEENKGFSGFGSTLENCSPYMSFLSDFIKKNSIKSVVDLGCGDWTFSKHINWQGIEYLGVDVVKFVVDQNNKVFSAPNIKFIHADATKTELPSADLLICKEVLQHLSNKEVAKILKQLPKYSHCLLIDDLDPDTDTAKNAEIPSGHWRPLDLTKPPFNLKGVQALKYNAHGNRKVVLYIRNNNEEGI